MGADERRATNKWARKGDRLMATEKASEKVACGIAEPDPVPPAAGQPAQHGVEGGPNASGPSPGFVAWSGLLVRKGLGSEADFSYWQC